MVIYSLPLAAVLVAAALRHHRPGSAAVVQRSLAPTRATLEALLALEQQLKRLRRCAVMLRVRCALERSVVAVLLYDADAQLALAQLQLSSERVAVVRSTREREPAVDDSAVAEALQHLEDLLSAKIRLVRRAHRRVAESAADEITVDVGTTCAVVQGELDELRARHHLQLSALYDALTSKRLCLRALDARIQRARLSRSIPRLSYEQVDDASVPMLEERDGQDESDDADDEGASNGDDGAGGHDANYYEHASI